MLNKKMEEEYQLASENDIKRIQISILQEVIKFCERENIKVFVLYGSLLGTIRHKGYIPWDDDIDLGMLRDDYERFVKGFIREESGYKVSSCMNLDKHPYPFAKIVCKDSKLLEQIEGKLYNIGINIDLFPLDNIPDDEASRKKLLRKIKLLKKIQIIKSINLDKRRVWYKTIFLRTANIILKPIKIQNICKRLDNIAAIDKDDNTKFVCPMLTNNCYPIISKSAFEDTIMMPFEDMVVPVPIGYDEILKKLYGDYMQLPPEEERNTHHLFSAYIKIK